MRDSESFAARYWNKRYTDGGNSGAGSYGAEAAFKTKVLNQFVAEHGIQSVIDFGCGDGNLLKGICYPAYLGFDVSATAVAACSRMYAEDSTKAFKLMDDYAGETADMTLSIDVLYHIIEHDLWEDYIRRLFAASLKHVIIFADNRDGEMSRKHPHVCFREFMPWIADHIAARYTHCVENPCGGKAHFYMFHK